MQAAAFAAQHGGADDQLGHGGDVAQLEQVGGDFYEAWDDGAVAALKSGKSLLPVGVVEVRGDFERGAVVACRKSKPTPPAV